MKELLLKLITASEVHALAVIPIIEAVANSGVLKPETARILQLVSALYASFRVSGKASRAVAAKVSAKSAE